MEGLMDYSGSPLSAEVKEGAGRRSCCGAGAMGLAGMLAGSEAGQKKPSPAKRKQSMHALQALLSGNEMPEAPEEEAAAPAPEPSRPAVKFAEPEPEPELEDAVIFDTKPSKAMSMSFGRGIGFDAKSGAAPSGDPLAASMAMAEALEVGVPPAAAPATTPAPTNKQKSAGLFGCFGKGSKKPRRADGPSTRRKANPVQI